MSSSFLSIYNLAMVKFDDPILSKIYLENTHEFFEIMNQKLVLAMSEFTIPETVSAKLADRVDPVFYEEVFDSDGTTGAFTLTEITLNSDCIVEARVNDSLVSISSIVGNVVTLVTIPQAGSENVKISVYIDGYFNQNLTDREKDILSLLIVKTWAEKEKNFLLDIRRLIGDKDFKLISEANSLREKSNWYTSIREEATKKMVALSWASSIADRRVR